MKFKLLMVDPTSVDMKTALAYRPKPYDVTLSNNDAILYSLGIGFQQDPMNRDHFRFSYENADGFAPFPTNLLVVCHRGPFAEGDFYIPGIPEFNPMMLLHGEEEIIIHAPLECDVKYSVQEKVADFQDKGKGGLLIFDSEIREAETNKLQGHVRSSLFIRGQGGFGHKGTIKQKFPKQPKREPDMVQETITTPN